MKTITPKKLKMPIRWQPQTRIANWLGYVLKGGLSKKDLDPNSITFNQIK